VFDNWVITVSFGLHEVLHKETMIAWFGPLLQQLWKGSCDFAVIEKCRGRLSV